MNLFPKDPRAYTHRIFCSFCPEEGREASGEIELPEGMMLPICQTCLDKHFAGIQVDTDADPE